MIPKAQSTRVRASLFAAMLTTMSLPGVCPAASPLKLAGALEGRVADEGGHPQMGAVVEIFNRTDRLVDRALSDGEGFFAFGGLLPDLYSVRITLGTFLPAMRNQIQVQAGRSSLLDISLSGLFSSIRMLPGSGHNGGAGDEDWKWVLRSSSATRPIFRYLPDPRGSRIAAAAHSGAPVFSDTRSLLRLSTGDFTAGPAGELGTAFALATSLFGTNQLEFAGDVGYGASSGEPSAAFRTTFSRTMGGTSPELSVTMRQIYLPRYAGLAEPLSADGDAGRPALRTMATGLSNKTQISDAVTLAYGFELDSVSFVDHLHYFSPYARLTYSSGSIGQIDLTYTSGNARPDLGAESEAQSDAQNAGLRRDVALLGAIPPVTLRSGRLKVQRGEDFEAAYSRRVGSRQYRVSAYHEEVQNAALMLASSDGSVLAGDVLPDLYTDSELFNAGNFHSTGYTASVTQDLGNNFQITVMYGSVGVLAPRSGELASGSADELRNLIHASQRQAVTTIASGTIPHAGTHFLASYELMDDHTLTAGHLYSTGSAEPEPGLNIAVRQPLPSVFSLPLRMEATADMRNLLAEGYLPISLADGRRLLLVHNPRCVRGGVNFRF